MLLVSCSHRGAIAPPAPPESGVGDRRSVEITVYNTGMGVVREVRAFALGAGAGEMRFADVAELIEPVSVLVAPRPGSEGFSVAEQNFEYDLISHAKLLEKYVGRDIKIIDCNGYNERCSAVDATLLSASGVGPLLRPRSRVSVDPGWEDELERLRRELAAQSYPGGDEYDGVVYRIGGKVYLGHPGIQVLPEIPGSLISRPTLSWRYESAAAREYELEVSYVTGGMSWEADYILALPPSGDTASLAGWVTIDNRSGASFEDAKLKLVAGKVNTLPKPKPKSAEAGYRAGYGGGGDFEINEVFGYLDVPASVALMDGVDHDFDRETAAPRFEQSGLFEYRMYDLQRPTSLQHNQKKQVNFMEAAEVKVEREYFTNSSVSAMYNKDDYEYHLAVSARSRAQSGQDGAASGQPVFEKIKFKNSEENGLGAPLPAGGIRVFMTDTLGRQLLAGDGKIDHAPRGEEVSVELERVPDIVVERVLADFKMTGSRNADTEWAITIRNRKEADVAVSVNEDAGGGEWAISESTHEYAKVDAKTFRFNVLVGAGQEVIIKYRITGVDR